METMDFNGAETEAPRDRQEAESKTPPKRFYTYSELMAEPDPEWLIEGIVPEGFMEIHAPPKAKKTFVAIDMALTVAAPDGDWFGRDVKHGPVVYVCAEGFTGIKKRMRAWVKAKGNRKRPDNIYIHKGAVDMLTEEKVKQFTAGILEWHPRPVLIVIDTLARCFGSGDENNGKDMGRFIKHCDKLREVFPGCSVLVLHHTGKEVGKGPRGHSSLRGAIDAGATITGNRNSGLFTLECTDMKEAVEFPDITLKLSAKGDSAVVVQGVSTTPKAKAADKLKPSEEKVLKVLKNGPLSWTDIKKRTKLSSTATNDALKALDGSRVRKEGDLWTLIPVPENAGAVLRDPAFFPALSDGQRPAIEAPASTTA